jgi:hypothetical protein
MMYAYTQSQMAELKAEFDHHTQDEEQKEMPRLLQSPGVDGVELGKQFEAAAAHAVTRPHTWAPDKYEHVCFFPHMHLILL